MSGGSKSALPDVSHETFGLGRVIMCSEKGCAVDFLGMTRIVGVGSLSPVTEDDFAPMVGEHVIDAKRGSE